MRKLICFLFFFLPGKNLAILAGTFPLCYLVGHTRSKKVFRSQLLLMGCVRPAIIQLNKYISDTARSQKKVVRLVFMTRQAVHSPLPIYSDKTDRTVKFYTLEQFSNPPLWHIIKKAVTHDFNNQRLLTLLTWVLISREEKLDTNFIKEPLSPCPQRKKQQKETKNSRQT